jgi:signal transduction histidine kinase
VLGGGLLAAIFLQVRLGLRPLARLRTAVADIRAGRRERLPTDQPAEVRPLVIELNSLLEQNAVNLARSRRHVANLAHGLKTPLATLAVALEELDHGSTGELHKLVVLMDRRIRHHLGRARAAATEGMRAPTHLGQRIADLALALPKIYAGKSIALDVQVAADLAVLCDPEDVDEMLGNLLDNAFKWARRRVSIEARPRDGQVEILVGDDGPGLAADVIQDVLQLGRRLDESAPGYGFGLPIALELAELYGGSLTLGRSPLGGLEATIVLPRAV